MAFLRKLLRVKAVNHGAKAVASLVLSKGEFARFERKMPLIDPFDIVVPNGERIRFEPYGDICSKFLRFGGWNGYEKASIELFYALSGHAEVTFDIGAYLGYFGLLAAAARHGAQAFLFEAVPALSKLDQRLAAINGHLRVEAVNAAVAERSGTIKLYLPADPFISDTSTDPNHRPNRVGTEVPAVSIDDFVRERDIQRVDLMKIDTETTEPSVLAGGVETIGRFRPAFICEVLPTANVGALEEFCRRFDYGFAWIRETGLARVDKLVPDAALRDLNYLFYPRGSAEGTAMGEEIQRRLKR